MEYGATIWNPHLNGDIDKIKRIQNRALRFAKKAYKSRETGGITRMREDLELETLEERQLSLRQAQCCISFFTHVVYVDAPFQVV
jgi:hypothetical protein